MKVTVLGNRSPYPTQSSGGSSYLVQNEDKNILLDVGPDTLHNLQKIIPCHELDAVIISHLHLDHFLDLLPLHHAITLALNNGYRDEALAVYLPFDESEELDFIRTKVGEEFHLQEINSESQLDFEKLKACFHPTTHSKECLGIKICDSTSMLGYTADTALDAQLVDFFTGIDMLLAEASLLEKDKDKRSLGHMTVGEAVQFGARAGVNKLLLTHLASTYDLVEIESEVPQVYFDVEITKVLTEYKV
ncbi:MBL fold metallo-hydrolase [Halanaerobacter jeridensis]|uniref:Ribonuclease BN (tRNA processing enzyme) n=1 Tax=Halanaerobacter jeridensis TaxID=706427 RepID=A0A938XR32_9FIRM|nr:MBL fold metallo-hydrolase [Halanaerobacter jeridensis]MBM7556139.1 ribonuclease BN (tRNA processing enzyme) [Halanaerobacter jeridensis]